MRASAVSSSVTTAHRNRTYTCVNCSNELKWESSAAAEVKLKHYTPTLIVKFLEARQASQHSEPVPARVGSAAGVLSQPEHSEACQRTQVGQLRERGNLVSPQVELAERQTASQRRERRDAVDAAGREEKEHHSQDLRLIFE